MCRTVVALMLFAALAVMQTGCASSGCKTEDGSIACIDPAKEKDLKSPEDDVAVTITVKNTRTAPVEVHWLDYDGARKQYSTVAAGAEVRQGTYEGHYWIILDENKKPLGIYKTPGKDGVILVK